MEQRGCPTHTAQTDNQAVAEQEGEHGWYAVCRIDALLPLVTVCSKAVPPPARP